ncbi:MAG: Uracil-DNA glycosylase superfamily [Rhodoglobus sp.]|nr:Uracil-DNA glycosylase superfamily [Rhodoglobus sp.]
MTALPDLVGPGVKLLFVGINPGLRTVAVGAHFAGRSNRFYPALLRAGILDRRVDSTDGLRPADLEHILARGVGITSLVARGTAKASELDDGELVAAVPDLLARIADYRPAVAAFLGVTAYRIAFQLPKAAVGVQAPIGGTAVWVVPNPSGLNAHETVDTLARAYREAAIAAGIDVYPQPD